MTLDATFPHKRLQAIERLALQRGSVRIDELAPVFGVSDVHVARGGHPFICLPYRPGQKVVGLGPAVDDS